MAEVQPDLAVYKILTPAQWERVRAKGRYTPKGVDARDGFVHFSRLGQVVDTVRAHFEAADELVIVEVATAPLIDFMRWEESRGGQLFPHLYGEWSVEEVRRTWDLARGADGGFDWPAEFLTS